MNEMIDALTRGIGIELSKPIRISYYEKKRYLEKDARYLQSPKEIKIFLVDVMALSIFNQQAITPLHGASNFSSGAKAYGVTRVRMGTYHLDKEFYTITDRITRQFFAICKEYGLNVEQLHISSVSEFTNLWLKVVKERGN